MRELIPEDLGIHKVTVPIPFPQMDDVNAYFIEDSEPAMIDTGINMSSFFSSGDGRKKIDEELATAGLELKDISRVFLTHGHPDHIALSQEIVRLNKNAKVYMHPADANMLLPQNADEMEARGPTFTKFLASLGTPKEVMDFFSMMSGWTMPVKLKEVEHLADNQIIKFDRFTMKVIHTPGHTRGQVCFLVEGHGILFSGDHILPKTSPIALPVPAAGEDIPEKFRSFIIYIESINKIRNLDLNIILPGHGENIIDYKGLLDRLDRFYKSRQDQLLKIIETKGASTVYDIAKEMFQVTGHMDVFLSMAEVLGHLEYMEEQGRLTERVENGIKLYKAA